MRELLGTVAVEGEVHKVSYWIRENMRQFHLEGVENSHEHIQREIIDGGALIELYLPR